MTYCVSNSRSKNVCIIVITLPFIFHFHTRRQWETGWFCIKANRDVAKYLMESWLMENMCVRIITLGNNSEAVIFI